MLARRLHDACCMTDPGKFQTLTAEISEGADGYVIAACLEIPGRASQGANRDEALANLTGAVEVRLDTMWQD